MKKLFIASGLLALMAAATSCDKYDIYDDQYGDVIMIKDGGDKALTVYSTDDYADLYISVMKSGHSPERQSDATLRLMTDEDLEAYKELNYGEGFTGLQKVDPSLYTLIDKDGNEVTAISHHFTGENDRYFGATLRVRSREFADWIRSKSEAERNAANFIVPVGLYSENDSINEYNNALIITPEDVDPEITCDVPDKSYNIADLSRRQLLRDAGKGLVYEPEVYMSIPCKNPWGFTVNIEPGKSSDVSTFNSDKANTVTLVFMSNTKKDENDQPIKRYAMLDKEGNETGKVEFKAGETKVRIPLTIYLDNFKPDEELDQNLVVPLVIKNSKNKPAIEWITEPEQVIKDRVKITPSTFFVGARVVEDPLPLDETCVSSNDCEPTEGSIAALFDDNLSTFFHSGWTVAFERSAPYGSYLEIVLPEEINSVFFNITARNTNQCSPKKIHLFYSNNIDDPDSWVFFEEATNKQKLQAGQSFAIGRIDKMYQAPETFKYMRFCVIENDKGESLLTTSTKIYWNLAELRLYGKIQ